MIVFTSIKNTAHWFELSFKDPKLTSSLIRWAKQEIEYFGNYYKSIVFGGEQSNFQVIADCGKIAHEQSNKVRLFHQPSSQLIQIVSTYPSTDESPRCVSSTS